MKTIINDENDNMETDKKRYSILIDSIEMPMIECDDEVLHYEAPETKLPDVKWAEL